MKVKIYTSPTCPYCKLAKDHLKDKGVEFENLDVSENKNNADQCAEVSGQLGVPVLDINGSIIVGWNKSAIDEALGL